MFPRIFTLPAFDLFGKELGPLTLHTYGVLLAVAFLAGLWAAGWHFWAFNIADAAINVGAVLFIADTLFSRRHVPEAV